MFVLVQPPLVQLNSPYPAPYYLKSFLEARGLRALAADHSIALFERIFCRAGLGRIFADAADRWSKKHDKRGIKNETLLYNMDRFLSEGDRWLACIDRLADFLRGRDGEFGHFLALANGALPGGPRFDACLDSLGGNPAPDAAPLLASKLLADLADFIAVALDPSFSLIRYAGNLGGVEPEVPGFRDFSAVEQGLGGYILKEFYRPLLEEQWDSLDRLMASETGETLGDEPLVIGVSVPFPGCLAGALACAASAKARYGSRAVTIAGGGYVSTELRFLDDPKVFDYFDYLAFDRGYGALAAILERAGLDDGDRAESANPAELGDAPLYKTMYRGSRGGGIVRGPGISADAASPEGEGKADSDYGDRFADIDREAARTVFPDYGGVDFSRYLRPVDDLNPMHRLWSDGHWLKAYLAHGCYWHRCGFCDVGLDYIRCFQPVDAEALFRHLLGQAEKTGIRGLHLVDEAAPAASLLRLAQLNREAGLPLNFWGNIRFDRDFTPDLAAVLAAGGLLGVSGGIEVATESGFKRVGKGISLGDVVKACAAFKEAGILAHAYLIYGYWDQDDQEIVDSAEILRQLFAAGLLDSAFWHKFVLTRHSRIYAEWKQGRHPALAVKGDDTQGAFALNDLSFEDDNRFDKFTAPLDTHLAAWMAGDSAGPTGFPFRAPKPTVPPDLVAGLLDEYAQNRDRSRAELPGDDAGRALFLGSRPIAQHAAQGTALFWRWRLEDQQLPLGNVSPEKAAAVATLLGETARGDGLPAAGFYQSLARLLGENPAKKAWKALRGGGLALI